MASILAFLLLFCFWYVIITIITKLICNPLKNAYTNSVIYYHALMDLTARLALVMKQFPEGKSEQEMARIEPFKTVYDVVNVLAYKSLHRKWMVFGNPGKKFYKEFGKQLDVISKMPGWSDKPVSIDDIDFGDN